LEERERESKNSPSSALTEIFNDECDAMVDMTLNDLYAKVRSLISVPIVLSIYDFL